MKKIWEWIRKIFKLKAPAEPNPAPGVLTELDKKLGQKIQQRQEKMGKPIDTHQGSANMPKYQPCPLCHMQAKRKRKTMGGAHYWCVKCKRGFFVRAK